MDKNKLLKQAAEKKKEIKKDMKDNLEGINWLTDKKTEDYVNISDYLNWSKQLTKRIEELKDLEKRIRILKTLN